MRLRGMVFALALLALPVQAEASEALWVNITALTGLYPDEGEMIILTPQEDGFAVAGRLKPSDVTVN